MKFNSLKLLAQTSIQYRSGKRLPLGLFNYDEYLPRTSIFWTLGRISWILNFTCLDAILFTKVAHTLFQHISEKRKPLSLLQSGLWFPRTSIFWTWLKDFIDTWFHLSWRNYVRESSSDFVSALLREAKNVWFVEIWDVFASDQRFIDFCEGFGSCLISLVLMKICLLK